jgi:ADP-heptose:LPS heptosyltransferase
MLNKFNFSHAFDLQNSSRTSFYRKYLLNISNWSSTETILEKGEKKKDFDKESVLERFNIQLIKSNVKTKHVLVPDLSWARANVDKIVNKYFGKKFVLLFPFCSPLLLHKKWTHFNELINLIKSHHTNIEIVVAPGPNEIEEAKKTNAIIVTNNNEPLSIPELAGLISKASYVIANDTGPAHMSAHLGQSGVVLFGYHTTAKKVSIETDKFKAISVDDLNSLTAEKVYSQIKDDLELIN